jgi:hypothetical protein
VPGRASVSNEKYFELLEDDDVKYLLGSMEPLDPDYTKKSLVEAERVYKYLEPFSEIRLQGSIMTNTHIRYYSDIDVLTLCPDFFTYEGPNTGVYGAYTRDPVIVLKALRKRSKDTISANFPAVKIEEKDRALALTGGSLMRKVDVVAANWLNTVEYRQSNAEKDRAIQVLDVAQSIRVTNKPFLHQHLLNEKNAATVDGLGRAVRMLKTLKVDAETSIAISSYDISALAWNMPASSLPSGEANSFRLAYGVWRNLLSWVTDEPALNALVVPNQTRKIIDREGTSKAAVLSLWSELNTLLEKIKATGKKLDREANVYGGRVLLQS